MCLWGRQSLRCMRNFLHISTANHSIMLVNCVTVGCCVKYVLYEPIIEYLVAVIRMNVSVLCIYGGKKGKNVRINWSTVCPTSFLDIIFMRTYLKSFDVLLTVHLRIFISLFNQLDAQNLFHNKFYFMPLHVSSTCASSWLNTEINNLNKV